MEVSPVFDGYTHVRIWTDAKDEEGNDIVYDAVKPTDNGRMLELTCPWGSQQMAENILNRINPDSGRAFRYQPYSAKNAMLDPAAELGDGVSVKDISSGIYSQTERFGVRHLSDIEAPTDEEIDHEYPYESQTNRKTERKFTVERNERIAQFNLLNDEIEAKVSKTYDNGTHTFGWRLTEDQFAVYSGTSSNWVLKVTSSGLQVKGSGTFSGEITATGGAIGSNSNSRINIRNGYIYSGSHDGYSSVKTGFYLGPSGISFGNGSKVTFSVSSSGNLTATSGTFDGTVRAGNITYGKDSYDYVHGNAISEGTIQKNRTNNGIQTSLSNGDTALSNVNTLKGIYKIEGQTAKIEYLDVTSLLTIRDPYAGRNKSVQVDRNTGILYLYGYSGPG